MKFYNFVTAMLFISLCQKVCYSATVMSFLSDESDEENDDEPAPAELIPPPPITKDPNFTTNNEYPSTHTLPSTTNDDGPASAELIPIAPIKKDPTFIHHKEYSDPHPIFSMINDPQIETPLPADKTKLTPDTVAKSANSPLAPTVQYSGTTSHCSAAAAAELVADTLSGGLRGLKGVINTSTKGTTDVLQSLGNAHNMAIDTVHSAIEKNVDRTITRMSSWAAQLDLMRRSLSGISQKNADKSHSITITTSSDAPIKTLMGLMDRYTGATSTDDPLPVPPLTSIDLSNFWGRRR